MRQKFLHPAWLCVLLFSVGAASGQIGWPGLPGGQTYSALDSLSDGRTTRSNALSYAPGASYESLAAPQPAQTGYLSAWRTWSTAFAGRSSLSGDSSTGTQDVTASVTGITVGADIELGNATLAGVALGTSRQTFSSNSSTGGSDDFTVTLYARRYLFDQAYVSGALGYGGHSVGTSRPATDLGFGVLEARYRAWDFGGRLEGGYTFSLGDNLLSPFGAFVGDSYHQPAYSETAAFYQPTYGAVVIFGPSLLGASFAAQSITVTHMEWGSRYGRYFALDGNRTLSLDATMAWERELDDAPFVLASFAALPGSSFAIPGTRPAQDTGLLGLGLRLQSGDGFSFGLRGDARLGVGTTIVSGTADLVYRW